ncbi:MAG: hypothetical protein GY749_41855 [Desulfobacteraceae bacterium]|nr:hypothetical protein [Desulfobacteraceae bacterium]
MQPEEPSINLKEQETEQLLTRDTPLTPRSFNDASASVRVIAATEKPIFMTDPYLRIPVKMIILVNGVVLPPSGQIPLLDSHDPTTVSSILGSVRNFKQVGTALECEVFFAGTKAGKEAAQLVKEGHLTDFSVGFRWMLKDSLFIPAGKAEEIKGQTTEGPARIIKRWYLKELSIVAIGANDEAKAVQGGDKPKPGEQEPAGLKIRNIYIVDIIFYTIILLMVLYLLKGVW